MRNRKKYLIIISMIMIMLLTPKTVYGVGLQANKNGSSKKNVNAGEFFELIKAMESSDGTLGISDNTKIDCHMALSTEWGTAAMLSASDFGRNADSSTTGNETGIKNMQNGSEEFVAGVLKGNTRSELTKIMSANSIYRNEYDSNLSKTFKGDALNLGSGSFGDHVLIRGYGGVFGYKSSWGNSSTSITSRAVVVNVGVTAN